MAEGYGGLDARQEKELVTELWNHVSQTERREVNREKEAERRHKERLAQVDTVVRAFTAGLRAFADAVDRQMR